MLAASGSHRASQVELFAHVLNGRFLNALYALQNVVRAIEAILHHVKRGDELRQGRDQNIDVDVDFEVIESCHRNHLAGRARRQDQAVEREPSRFYLG